MWSSETAHAWEIGKSSNGVVVMRSAEETGDANVDLLWDYKGGETWSSSFAVAETSSYRSSRVMAYLPASSTRVGSGVEIPLEPGFRCQLVTVAVSGEPSIRFAVLNEPLEVTGDVEVDTAGGAVDVRLVDGSATVTTSVDGTMPVSVVDFERDAEWYPYAIGALVLVAGVWLGLTLVRGAPGG